MPHRTDIGRGVAAAASLLALTLAAVGCGNDDGSGAETSPPTESIASGETVRAEELRSCLESAGVQIGEAAPDAVVASYAEEAVAAGGESFVIEQPISQVIVAPEPVDLAEAEDELRQAADRAGGRATGMQADAYGNVVIVYFTQEAADKSAVNGCLAAPAEPIPGLETPYQPPAPAPVQ